MGGGEGGERVEGRGGDVRFRRLNVTAAKRRGGELEEIRDMQF